MRDKGRKVIIGFLLAVSLAAAGYLIWYYMLAAKTEQAYEEARNSAYLERADRPEKEEDRAEKAEIPIDFKKLQNVNEDVYAWIRIEGTNIDYPVVQSLEDDKFYLEHTWEKKAAPEGAIFTQACNAKNFTDFNTVIYGHQMGDRIETMFHNLSLYLDEGFMETHPEITVYTREHVLTYRVFAAVVYDDRHLVQSFNYVMDKERQRFLDSILNSRDLRNRYSEEEEVSTSDRILSLSTCIAGEPKHRLLVEAVLIDEK